VRNLWCWCHEDGEVGGGLWGSVLDGDFFSDTQAQGGTPQHGPTELMVTIDDFHKVPVGFT